MRNLKIIEKKINQLSPGLMSKLDDYLDYLTFLNGEKKPSKSLKQDWAGGLKEFKKKYSSVELQKLALKWRTE